MARRRLVRGLESGGCGKGDLRLAVATHGDVDHIGNSAYLRRDFGAKIAMHEFEARAGEIGDMLANRKAKPDRLPWIFKLLSPFGGLIGRAEPFNPDLLLEDGRSLADYGVDATVLHLPAHSKGSIAVLPGTATSSAATCSGTPAARGSTR